MTTSRTSEWIRVGILGAVVVAGGCASTRTTTRQAASDFRGNAAVSTPAPRLLVAGPVRLLHVNVDRKAGATFLRVPSYAGASPDCRSGIPLTWNGESDLDVDRGESVCVAVRRDARVSWHARAIPAEPVSGTQRASLR
jgi:hypothetical protein